MLRFRRLSKNLVAYWYNINIRRVSVKNYIRFVINHLELEVYKLVDWYESKLSHSATDTFLAVAEHRICGHNAYALRTGPITYGLMNLSHRVPAACKIVYDNVCKCGPIPLDVHITM